MPWEERSGRRYYYRKVREGDHVRSVYVGRGAHAEAVARADAAARAKREARQQALRREKKAHKRTEDAALKAERFIRAVRDAALVASGYHTHKGQWRKSRSYNEDEVQAMAETLGDLISERFSAHDDAPPSPHVQLPASVPKDVQELIERVRSVKAEPCAQDRAELERALRDHPEIVEAVGDVAQHARDVTVRANFKHAHVRAAVRKKMDALRSELAFETAGSSPVPTTERLLIEQVVIMWAQFYAVQIKYERVLYGSHPLERGRYWEKRLDAAQRRYLRALRTLSNVRKLNVTVQINAAKYQQVANL